MSKKHTEPQTGLHNLLTGSKKAAKLKELVMAEFTRAVLPLTITKDSLVQVTDIFIDTCVGYYGSDYPIGFKGVIRNGENRIVLHAMNLTSLILFYGFDLPPLGLPEEGEWEGEEWVYSLHKDGEIEVPKGVVSPKLVV